MPLKIDKYFDVCCDICSRHRSTDFYLGWETNLKRLRSIALNEGWTFTNGQNICPICNKKTKEKECKN